MEGWIKKQPQAPKEKGPLGFKKVRDRGQPGQLRTKQGQKEPEEPRGEAAGAAEVVPETWVGTAAQGEEAAGAAAGTGVPAWRLWPGSCRVQPRGGVSAAVLG